MTTLKWKASEALTPLNCREDHPEAKPCSRCHGRGFLALQIRVHCGQPGTCFKCDGSGFLGGPAVEASRLPKLLASRVRDGECERARFELDVRCLVLTCIGLPERFGGPEYEAKRVQAAFACLTACRERYALVRDRIALLATILAERK